MLTDQTKKRRKLSVEILVIVAICFALSMVLYLFLVYFAPRLVEEYCFFNDIVLDEFDLYRLDVTMYTTGVTVSVVFFIVMFFSLFGERLAYIRKITLGVDSLRNGNYGNRVELIGNNELTELAEAVNYLSQSERNVKEKEKRLNEEREELIRTLSHDIRTPLTSLMAYTELLAAKKSVTNEDYREYISLVSKKTAQIKELTDILLDGGRREVERFADARLLFEQLAEEFEDELGEDFPLSVSLPSVAFQGRFDVGELRRIFDNLISNIGKYADPEKTVELSVTKTESGIVIHQANAVRQVGQPIESYRMGLNSIRRIAQNYGGTVEVSEADGQFEITVVLSDI